MNVTTRVQFCAHIAVSSTPMGVGSIRGDVGNAGRDDAEADATTALLSKSKPQYVCITARQHEDTDIGRDDDIGVN
jgi:hypothetical protein